MRPQPKYEFRIYPSLLDSFQSYLDVNSEEFFYQDEGGNWHRNYDETTGEYHFSDEEVCSLAFQRLIDRINRKELEKSEAADRGTCFNEIVDCIIKKEKPHRSDISIWTAKEVEAFRDLGSVDETGKPDGYDYWLERIKHPCIVASMNGYVFFYDINFCKDAAKHFGGSLCQVYTSAPLETKYGLVELYGFADYLRERTVFDAKTTKQYQFGKYEKSWQKHVYPYCFVRNGQCTEIQDFEYTCFKLSGGTERQPIITGQMYPEVYSFNYDKSKELVTKHCERFIEFLLENKDLITDRKIFGKSN